MQKKKEHSKSDWQVSLIDPSLLQGYSSHLVRLKAKVSQRKLNSPFVSEKQ